MTKHQPFAYTWTDRDALRAQRAMNAFDTVRPGVANAAAAWKAVVESSPEVPLLVSPYAVAIPQIFWKDGNPREIVVAGSLWTMARATVRDQYSWDRKRINRFNLGKRVAWEEVPSSIVDASENMGDLCRRLHDSNPNKYPAGFYVLTDKNRKRNARLLFDYWANSAFRHAYVHHEAFDWTTDYEERPHEIGLKTQDLRLRFVPVLRPRKRKVSAAQGPQAVTHSSADDAIALDVHALEAMILATRNTASELLQDDGQRHVFSSTACALRKLVGAYVPWPDAAAEHVALREDVDKLCRRALELAKDPLDNAKADIGLNEPTLRDAVTVALDLPSLEVQLQGHCDEIERILFSNAASSCWEDWARENSGQGEHPDVVRVFDVVEEAVRTLAEFGSVGQRNKLNSKIGEAVDLADAGADVSGADSSNLLQNLLRNYVIPNIPTVFGNLVGPRSLHYSLLLVRSEWELVQIGKGLTSETVARLREKIKGELGKLVPKEAVDEFDDAVRAAIESGDETRLEKVIQESQPPREGKPTGFFSKSGILLCQVFALYLMLEDLDAYPRGTDAEVVVRMLKVGRFGAMTVQTLTLAGDWAGSFWKSLIWFLEGAKKGVVGYHGAITNPLEGAEVLSGLSRVGRWMGGVINVCTMLLSAYEAVQSWRRGEYLLMAAQIGSTVFSGAYALYLLLVFPPAVEAFLLMGLVGTAVGCSLFASVPISLPANGKAVGLLEGLGAHAVWRHRATSSDGALFGAIRSRLSTKVPLSLWYSEYNAQRGVVNPPGSTHANGWDERLAKVERILCEAGCDKEDLARLTVVYVRPDADQAVDLADVAGGAPM
jgi:hypothetical protein